MSASFADKNRDKLYFRIGDVADLLGVKAYVLRYWETEFSLVHPEKSATGQRVYKKGDVQNLFLIKHLLYHERYSVEGARKRLSELKKNGELRAFKKQILVGSDFEMNEDPSTDEVRSESPQDSGAVEEPATELRLATQKKSPSPENRAAILRLMNELRTEISTPLVSFFKS